MTKRRAEHAPQHEAPLKRRAGPPCVAVAAARGPAAPPPPAPAGSDSRKKRPRVWEEREEQEERESPAPPKWRCVNSAPSVKNGTFLANSGSFQDTNNVLAGGVSLSSRAETPQRRPQEGATLSHVTKSRKTIPTEDDLSAFNSFQFWREPLPDLDFSLLQCDDGEPAKQNSVLSEGDAMEFIICDNTASKRKSLNDQILQSRRSWIEETFCKRDCVKFIPASRNPHRCYPLCQICQSLIRCCCGRLIAEHHSLNIRLPRSPSQCSATGTGGAEEWSVKLHTEASPTDAFGTIDFQDSARSGRAKYLRLSCDTKPDQVLQLMLKEWQMDMPKLVISLHGSTENFDLPLKVRRTFGKALIRAAETTGAWILTEGINTGVSRYLGEATKLYGTHEFHKRYIIGIAPWGIIQNHSDLVGKDVLRPYQTLGTPVYKRMSLNSQHSHFLLVDDGTVGMYGGQLELRRRLERQIRLQKIHSRLRQRVPVLCVAMAGGPELISLVLEYAKSVPPVPTAVYEGTGQAADLLAFVYKQTSAGRQLDPDIKEDVLLRIQKRLNLGKAQSNHIFKLLMECMNFRDSITIVDLESEDQQDLDMTVLTALLKGSTKASAPDQLSIALAWDRVDVAKKHILVYGQHWKVGSLEQALLDALVMDRVNFVKLLIENGLNMNRFLTVSRLEQLYNTQEPTNCLLYHLVENVKQSHLPVDYWITLIDVGLVIEYLLGGAFRSTYTRKHFRAGYRTACGRDKESSKTDLGRLNKLSAGSSEQLEEEDRGSSCPHFFRTTQPYKQRERGIFFLGARGEKNAEVNEFPIFLYTFSDLFVWAVLKKRQKMALFLWQHGEEIMARAVVACKLYRSMAYEARQANMGDSTAEELKIYSLEFGQLAVDLLDGAFRQNERMAMKLLTYEMKDWSNFTCLQMAVSSGLHPFVSHSCTQMLLTDLWMGRLNMRKNSWFKIILSILLPPVILMLEFKSQAEMSHVPQMSESFQFDRESEAQGDVDSEHTNTSPTQYDMEKGPENITSQDMLCTRKVYEFYSAPVVKFWFHTMAYLVFLMLYSYTVLVKMGPEPSIQEWLVIVYIFTTALEKVREVLISEPKKLSKKLKVWFSEYWNCSDFIAILLFFVGFVLRCHHSPFRTVGRITYCLDIIFWYVRLLDLFTIHQHVGPYLTMLTKMTTNMFNVVIMMAIVLVTFGVPRKAILAPEEPPSWSLAKDVVFQPYWMIFGEVYAGEIDACANNQPCGPGSFITPFLQAVYLFVQYIIMVNTLIAFFNNVYMSMKSISDKIWKCNRYRYIMTYQAKPWLPPPFIVLNHLTLFITSISKKHSRRDEQNSQCGLKLYLSREDIKKLHDFEEKCVIGYFHKKKEDLHCSEASRIRVTKERVEEITGELHDVAEKVHIIKETLQSVDSQLGRLQDLSALTVDTLTVLLAKDTHRVEEAFCQLPCSWNHVGHLATSVESSRHKLHKQRRSTTSSLMHSLVCSPGPSLDEQDWRSVFSFAESHTDSKMSVPLSISCSHSPLSSPQHVVPLGSMERTSSWSCDSSQSFHPLFVAESPESLHTRAKMHNSYFSLNRKVSVEEEGEEEEEEENDDDDDDDDDGESVDLRTSLVDSHPSESVCGSSEQLTSSSKWMHSSVPALHYHLKRSSRTVGRRCSFWAKRTNTTLGRLSSQQRGLSRSFEVYLLRRRESKVKARNLKTVKILERSANVSVRLSGSYQLVPYCIVELGPKVSFPLFCSNLIHSSKRFKTSSGTSMFGGHFLLKRCLKRSSNNLKKKKKKYIYIYIYIYIHTHTHARTHAHTHTHTHIYIYIYIYNAVERNNLMRLASTIPFTPVCVLAGEEVSVYSLEESAADGQGCTVSTWSERGFSALLQPMSQEGMDGGLRRAMRVVCTWAEGHVLKPGNIYIIKAFRPEVVKTWQKVFHSNTALQLCLREIQQQRAAQKLMNIFNQIKPQSIPYAPRFLDVCLLHWHSEDKWLTIEKYMAGDFRKYNNNTGEEMSPNSCLEETILAFSHWTYHFSRGELLVLDLQGVSVELTDPSVVRSADKSVSGDMVFGPANLGEDAIQSFVQNHTCNSCCRKLHLSDLRSRNNTRGEVNLAFEDDSEVVVTRL
ncbi:transient receptor potential cation channel subfamily M member 6-like [Arapaima gigas]